MKHLLPVALLIALAACHKSDVDIAALNTNPVDPEYAGPARMVVDSIWTEEVIAGTLYRQLVRLSVDEAAFASGTSYEVRVIETTDQDTATVYSVMDPDFDHLLVNNLVDLGTEYCYDLTFIVGGWELEVAQYCALAEL